MAKEEREYLINTTYFLCKKTLFTRKSIYYKHVINNKNYDFYEMYIKYDFVCTRSLGANKEY